MEDPNEPPTIDWRKVRVALERSTADMVEHVINLKRIGRNNSAASARSAAATLGALANALKEGGA